MNLWHRRMAHLNVDYLRLLQRNAATGISFDENQRLPQCKACIRGKLARKPFNRNVKRAGGKLGLVHTELCEMETKSMDSMALISILKEGLSSTFSMKDLGQTRKCFGINVKRNRSKEIIQLDQSDYILNLS